MYGFCIYGLKEASRKEHYNHGMDHGVQVNPITDHSKRLDRSDYISVYRPSESHALLSSHHRADGNSVHIPVGDILRTESKETCLEGPCT